MSTLRFAVAMLWLAVSLPVAAQPAIIDWSAKPRPFSEADYAQLLTCTIKVHPEESRRYATYHLIRRDTQAPEQNERDPDSQLLMPALEGCLQMKNGEVYPFSLDRLIGDWGTAYNVGVAPADMTALAACIAKNYPGGARAYLQFQEDGSEKSARIRRLLTYSILLPPCSTTRRITLDHAKFAPVLRAALTSQKVAE